MAKSQETYSKKEKEKKRLKKKKEKQERREKRKLEKAEKGTTKQEDNFMYLDENGNLTSTPPDPTKKRKEIKSEDIQLGVPKREAMEVEKVRQGKVKFFNEEKGYGFITDNETKESVFVHVNNVQGDQLNENDKVSFEVEMGPKGPAAINVTLI